MARPLAGLSSSAPGSHQFTWPTTAAYTVTVTATMSLYFTGTPFLEALLSGAALPAVFLVLLVFPRKTIDVYQYLAGLNRTQRMLDTVARFPASNRAVLLAFLTNEFEVNRDHGGGHRGDGAGPGRQP